MPLVDPVTVEGVELDRSWITPIQTARLHLLPAHKAPVCIIIRRKPSKLFHIIRWDTSTGRCEHGSWFHGKLYPMRCDVSWDGHWMVYLAMGANGETWNGLCRPPWLRTSVDCPNVGTWAGGGLFAGMKNLSANTMWHAPESLGDCKSPPGGLKLIRQNSGGEDEPVLFPRLVRDGWERCGANEGKEHALRSMKHKYYVATVGDDGWAWKPSRNHPTLRMWHRGYFERGRTFEFELEGHDGILDASVEWATWSNKGDLLVARLGRIQRYTLRDIKDKKPSFELDLNSLEPPLRGSDDAQVSK